MFEYENEGKEQMTANAQKAEVLRQEMKAWIQENHPDTPDNKVYVPKIVLKSGVRKWGNGIKQVQAPVLIIECIASETVYLKLYLEFGYETKQLEMGQFVLSGLHLMAGKAIYKGLLCQKNAWLDRMSVVIIEGLSYDAMYVPVKLRSKIILVQTIIVRKG